MIRWPLALLLAALLTKTASACSIPVFRYALEHWPPDSFAVVVFHRGELSREQQVLLEQLQPVGPDGAQLANVRVRAIDLEIASDPSVQQLWNQQQTETLPWMAVHAPALGGGQQRIWAGAFSDENVRQLTNSPARQDISERLLSGDSVVWVFLESGHPEKDEPAYDLLTTQLSRLETELKLPQIEAVDLEELSTEPEALKLSFSTVRVSRTDPVEAQFVNMLLHVESDLMNEEYAEEPMVFPIFGRGRVLYSLVGEGITASTIEEAAQFLVGECQCVVKVQNPGVDTLLSVAWDRYFQPAPEVQDNRPLLVDMKRFARSPQSDQLDDEAGVEDDETGELLAVAPDLLEERAVASSKVENVGPRKVGPSAVQGRSSGGVWGMLLLLVGAVVIFFAVLPRSK